MSIQQSFNQMLTIAAGGAALYSRSPGVVERKQREEQISRLEKAYQRGEKASGEWEEPTDKEAGPELAKEMAQHRADLAQQLYELDPTEARYKTLVEDKNAVSSYDFTEESKEAKAYASLAKRVETMESKMTEFEKRKAILKKSRKKGGR